MGHLNSHNKWMLMPENLIFVVWLLTNKTSSLFSFAMSLNTFGTRKFNSFSLDFSSVSLALSISSFLRRRARYSLNFASIRVYLYQIALLWLFSIRLKIAENTKHVKYLAKTCLFFFDCVAVYKLIYTFYDHLGTVLMYAPSLIYPNKLFLTFYLIYN